MTNRDFHGHHLSPRTGEAECCVAPMKETTDEYPYAVVRRIWLASGEWWRWKLVRNADVRSTVWGQERSRRTARRMARRALADYRRWLEIEADPQEEIIR